MRALIFDFDGLILDTETSLYEGWRLSFEAHGHALPLETWRKRVGRVGAFDPLARLRELVGEGLDEERMQRERRRIRDAVIEALDPEPGVCAWLEEARGLGLRLAVASSSELSWVGPHLERLGLLEHFDVVATGDDVEASKPHPAVYHFALERLGVSGAEAVALEDSVNGAQAAARAGCFCVAVPNRLMRDVEFEAAHLVLDSLAERSLREVLTLARSRS